MKGATVKKIAPPSPVQHPNAYAGFSVSMVAGLLVYELHNRLGVDITDQESLAIVSGLVALALFFGKKVK